MLSTAVDWCDTLADVRQAFAMQPAARFIPWLLPLRRLNAGFEESVQICVKRETLPCGDTGTTGNGSSTPGGLSGDIFSADCAGASAKA